MTDDLPTLFTMPGTCALSVQIALEWAGADYELRVLDRGANREPAYLAINPAGQVPTITLQGEPVLTEAHALLLLVADSHPESELAPPSSRPMDRYRLEQLLAFMTSEVHGAFVPFFVPDRFVEDDGQTDAVKQLALLRAEPLLARLDVELGEKGFILGRRTVADPYLYVLARWASNFEHDLQAMPNLRRFRTAMEADRVVAASLESHGMAPLGAGLQP